MATAGRPRPAATDAAASHNHHPPRPTTVDPGYLTSGSTLHHHTGRRCRRRSTPTAITVGDVRVGHGRRRRRRPSMHRRTLPSCSHQIRPGRRRIWRQQPPPPWMDDPRWRTSPRATVAAPAKDHQGRGRKATPPPSTGRTSSGGGAAGWSGG
jgi:hypothetical protein